MLSRLFIAAVWLPAGNWLVSLLLFVMFDCIVVTSPCGILGQVWYLIVSFPDLCHLYYFEFSFKKDNNNNEKYPVCKELTYLLEKSLTVFYIREGTL